MERNHRRLRTHFNEHERAQGQNSAGQTTDDERMMPSQSCGLDESINQAAQSNGHQSCPHPVNPAGVRAASLGNVAKGYNDYRRGERDIDIEHPMPRGVLDQPSAEHWAESGSDGGEAGPCSDGAAA